VPELGRVNDQERLFSLLIERNTAGQQNESLFIFLSRYPQFLSRVETETIQTNLSRIPIANLSQLSQVQVASILPTINAPLPDEGQGNTSTSPSSRDASASSESPSSTRDRNSPGAQRLLAIGIARLHEFGLLSRVNLEMFHPDELMQFIGDRQDLIPSLIGSIASSQNESVFDFADRFPQYLSRITPEAIQANLSRIPIANLSNLSQGQVAAILPHINAPVLNEALSQSASSSEQNANPPSGEASSPSENANPSSLTTHRNSPGAQRLLAIGIGKLHEFGLLGQVHLGMFHPDEWMLFIGDRQDLVPNLIESSAVLSLASVFSFTDRYPQFLSDVPVPTVKANLARIPIQNFSNLSREQVVEILPMINDPIFEDGGISVSSSLFNSAIWSVGPRRLIAIGIARLYEFGLLGQINLGFFDDNELIQFISGRGDLLPHVEFGGLEASLQRIPIPMIRDFEDTLLQRFSLSSLGEETVREIGLWRFALEQLERHFRQNPNLIKMVDRSRIMALDVRTLMPSLIAVLYDDLSDSQTREINLHHLPKEEIGIILDGKYSRIKRLDDWGVAQNYEKLPDEAKIVISQESNHQSSEATAAVPQRLNHFTASQIRALVAYRKSITEITSFPSSSSSTTTNSDSSSSTGL
jgi:hypothetical protein